MSVIIIFIFHLSDKMRDARFSFHISDNTQLIVLFLAPRSS